MSKVVVVGGGAAGMIAAYSAAMCGHQVSIYEKNEKLGKKLFITGKGRCNVTNASDMEVLFQNVVTNPKFLYSAFYTFTNEQMMDLMEEAGVPLKVERGNRVFPQSDKSSDVIRGLERLLKQYNVKIYYNSKVRELITQTSENEHNSTKKSDDSDNAKKEKTANITKKITGVILADGKKIQADAVILTTGGVSYKMTGSSGDGLNMAKNLGHHITKLRPALVPVVLKEEYVPRLQGLSLKNISVRFMNGKKQLYQDFGEMLFTHYGVSGPVILSGSSYITSKCNSEEIKLILDLKPALTEAQLDARILRDFEECKNKDFKNSLDSLLPKKMIPIIIELSGIEPDKKIHEITKEERKNLGGVMKNMTMTVTGVRGFEEAIITRGGVNVKEVNPATMESKLVSGLYFAGEMLDLDALTGGYNLQIAWSTGYLAGLSVQ